MQSDNQQKKAAQLLQQHDDEHHLMDYVRVVYKRRWIAIPALVVVFLTGAVNSFRTTPLYEARTQLLIEKDTPKVASLNTMFQEQDGWYNDDFYQTQYKILQSRTLARRTVVLMNLTKHPSLQQALAPRSAPITVTGLMNGAVSLARRAVMGAPAKPAAKAQHPEGSDPVAPYVGFVLGSLNVVPVRNSRIVELRVTSSEPQLASDMANGIAQAYIQQNLEARFSASKDATDWFGGQLAEQRKKVEETEVALQRYKETHDAIAVEDRENIVVQRLADLNGAVTKAKTTRIEKEALYAQLKAVQGTSAVDTFTAVLGNEYIQKLKSEVGDFQRQEAQLAEKYGERHPEMVRIKNAVQVAQAKFDNEVNKVVESVRAEYMAALAQERSLTGALDAQKSEALGLNRKGIEYTVLQREAESNRQVYESLLQRTKETGISGELKSSNIRVVDPAEVPTSPVLPRRSNDLMMALLAGSVLALGLVFLFEYLDNRIKSPQELRALNLAFLGMVPRIDNSGPTLLNDAVPPAFGEAIRAVRTNVLFSSAEEGVRTVVVTSAGPGEGKSLFSSNLSVSLAQAGQRVLHIDADMRRPRVHDIFDVSQEPGLLEPARRRLQAE